MTYLLPYRALLRGRAHPVRPATRDEEGLFILERDDERVSFDEPADLLSLVAHGEEVTADFDTFALVISRGSNGRPLYLARAQGVEGAQSPDDELACWTLLDALGDARAPRACFFCRWSDVEPSSGWGNLGCAVAHADAYDAVATSSDARRRKWGHTAMLSWVMEWHSCERFEVRPYGYGYRGRPMTVKR